MKDKLRKILLFASLLVLLFTVACQSAESKEIIEYHNGYIDNVESEFDSIDALIDQMWSVESDEEVKDIITNELEPKITAMKEYMDEQDPKKEDTIAYHELRSGAIHAISESIELSMKAIQGLVDETITEDEFEDMLDQADEKSEEAAELGDKANDKIDELAEKHNLEEENE